MAHRSRHGNSITLTVLILQLAIEGADKNWALFKKKEMLKKSSNIRGLKIKVDFLNQHCWTKKILKINLSDFDVKNITFLYFCDSFGKRYEKDLNVSYYRCT